MNQKRKRRNTPENKKNTPNGSGAAGNGKGLKKGTKTGLLVVLGLLLFTMGLGISYVNNLLGSMERDPISRDDGDLGIGDQDFVWDDSDLDFPGKGDSEAGDLTYYYENVTGVTTIALFGVDAEDGARGRSDAIMLVTVDRNADKIKLTTIVRDSYVNIPGRGMDKINHAYAFGGPQLALRTLNSNFHLDIRYFASVNFTSLPKIIDILGGVELKVTAEEAAVLRGISGAGTHKMTGAQALAFSRIRKIDSDFERGRRQRDVMEAAIKKMLQQPVTSYPRVLNQILPLMTTNMSSGEILGMGTSVVTNNIRTIEQSRFPAADNAKGQMINGIYYYVFDRTATIHQMGRYLYLDQR